MSACIACIRMPSPPGAQTTARPFTREVAVLTMAFLKALVSTLPWGTQANYARAIALGLPISKVF
jgi:hypothetical protein